MYDQSQNNLKFFGSKKTKGPKQNSQLKSAKVTYARGVVKFEKFTSENKIENFSSENKR
jgi:hypothetical protein